MTRNDVFWTAFIVAAGCKAFYGLYKHLTHKPAMLHVPREPLTFADTARIDKIAPDLRNDFVRRILQTPWAFISDESSLWDFSDEPTLHELQGRILDVYQTDIVDISDGNIASILERLEGLGVTPSVSSPESQ